MASGGPPYYGRWSVGDVYEAVLDGTWVTATPPEPESGGVLMMPTSISYSGTSASISTLGSVSFTACSSLSLNGVFTGDYDNYQVSIFGVASARGWLHWKLRSSGTDDSTSNYNYQRLSASSTTVSAGRATALAIGYAMLIDTDGSSNNGVVCSFYGPHLSQPTAFRSVTCGVDVGADISDFAMTHGASSTFDGLTILPQNGNFSGRVAVYGLKG